MPDTSTDVYSSITGADGITKSTYNDVDASYGAKKGPWNNFGSLNRPREVGKTRC